MCECRECRMRECRECRMRESGPWRNVLILFFRDFFDAEKGAPRRTLRKRLDPHRQAIDRGVAGRLVERHRVAQIVVTFARQRARARDATVCTLVTETMRQANHAG